MYCIYFYYIAIVVKSNWFIVMLFLFHIFYMKVYMYMKVIFYFIYTYRLFFFSAYGICGNHKKLLETYRKLWSRVEFFFISPEKKDESSYIPRDYIIQRVHKRVKWQIENEKKKKKVIKMIIIKSKIKKKKYVLKATGMKYRISSYNA